MCDINPAMKIRVDHIPNTEITYSTRTPFDFTDLHSQSMLVVSNTDKSQKMKSLNELVGIPDSWAYHPIVIHCC